MHVTLYWNDMHDIAAIKFVGGYVPQELPSMAINAALEGFYNQNADGANLHPFIYEIWDPDSDKNIGLMLTESVEGDDMIFHAMWKGAIDNNIPTPQVGVFGPKDFDA